MNHPNYWHAEAKRQDLEMDATIDLEVNGRCPVLHTEKKPETRAERKARMQAVVDKAVAAMGKLDELSKVTGE